MHPRPSLRRTRPPLAAPKPSRSHPQHQRSVQSTPPPRPRRYAASEPRPSHVAAPPRRLEALRGILPQPRPCTRRDFPGTPPWVSLPTATILRRRRSPTFPDLWIISAARPHTSSKDPRTQRRPASTPPRALPHLRRRSSPTSTLRSSFGHHKPSVSTPGPLLSACAR